MNTKKKILISLGAVLAVVAGIAVMSAYEAHVVNVIAHIENALSVSPKEIDFGTVFPQEYVEDSFTVSLSSSFLGEERVDDVEYVIRQKPKPIWGQTEDCAESIQHWFEDVDEAREYCHDYPENTDCCYLSLCPFLSKLPQEGDGDTGEDSYYDSETKTCPPREPLTASGILSKKAQDIFDVWNVDLKVPPVAGFVGQDWPQGCPVVDEDSQDYGCDLWIEVTNISENGISLGDNVGLWHFNEGEGETAYDSSEYGNHAAIYGATWASPALSFDGYDDYVDAGNASSLSTPSQITVSFWMYPDSAIGLINPINPISKRDLSGTESWAFEFKTYNGNPLGFWIYDGGWRGQYVYSLPSLNTWYHIVGTYDGSQIKFYVDGVELGSFAYSGDIDISTDNVVIGNSGDGTRPFNGMLDEVSIYNRALDSTEVQNLYLLGH
jgi:hypothetical protein